VAIDFRLTARQRELQLQSRKVRKGGARAGLEAELCHSRGTVCRDEDRYEAMVSAGLLRKCIPLSAGGENAGLTDTRSWRGALRGERQR